MFLPNTKAIRPYNIVRNVIMFNESEFSTVLVAYKVEKYCLLRSK